MSEWVGKQAGERCGRKVGGRGARQVGWRERVSVQASRRAGWQAGERAEAALPPQLPPLLHIQLEGDTACSNRLRAGG